MDRPEQIQQSVEQRGVYTLTDADLRAINEIEEDRRYFNANIDSLSNNERMNYLTNVLSDMQVFMEGYQFDAWLKKQKSKGHTFYNVKDAVEDTEGDIDFIRHGSEIAFTIWKQFLGILGVKLPTEFFRPET